MIVVEELVLVIVAVLLVGSIVRGLRITQQQRRLEAAFYRSLLESNDHSISLIQLATVARVEADTARQYLEAQVRAFSATAETDVDGDTFYRFPKLQR